MRRGQRSRSKPPRMTTAAAARVEHVEIVTSVEAALLTCPYADHCSAQAGGSRGVTSRRSESRQWRTWQPDGTIKEQAARPQAASGGSVADESRGLAGQSIPSYCVRVHF
jgi:hypothetical protein